jgi:hypothetical protein
VPKKTVVIPMVLVLIVLGLLMSLPGEVRAQEPDDETKLSAAEAQEGQQRRHVLNDNIADTPAEIDALHHPGQHEPPTGHLPGSSENVNLVGKVTLSNVEEGQIADVGTLGNFAYLASFSTPNCDKGGVYIVDIRNPEHPEEVDFIPTAPGSFVGEGVQAISIKTQAFRGDILVFNNEICADTGEQIGGFSIYDVTNPLNAKPLVIGAGDTDPGGFLSTANQIHSIFAWQQGDRAFAVIVDDEEFEDVDIFDISDPRNPVMIAEVGLDNWPDAQNEQSDGIGEFAASFLHDMVVKRVQGHWLMLLSYWDAGYIILNVDDPANPVFVNDTDFSDPDPETGFSPAEGNAHQAEFSYNSRFIIATDEDFSPYHIKEFQITTGPNAGLYPAISVGGAASAAILPDQKLNGPIVYGGYGCPGGTPIPPRDSAGLPPLEEGEEAIVVLQRGPIDDPSEPLPDACFPGEKAHEAVLAGYDGVVFVNRHLGDPSLELPPFCGSGGFLDEVAAACTTHEAFHRMFNTEPDFSLPYPPEPNTEPDIGTLGEKVELTVEVDGWGYVHLFDAKTLEELDTYAIPEALDPAFADDFGDLSVHEVAVDPSKNIGYLSYYAGGLRVIRFDRDEGIREVGHYIDELGNNFWGVQIYKPARGKFAGQVLVLASDRDSGLWIFKFTDR